MTFSQCNYIAESVGSRCRDLKHSVTRLRAMKRCFKCGTCGQRTFTYNERFPRQLCQYVVDLSFFAKFIVIGLLGVDRASFKSVPYTKYVVTSRGSLFNYCRLF